MSDVEMPAGPRHGQRPDEDGRSGLDAVRRFRATFKNGWNEAEPPRSAEFTAADLPEAKSYARRHLRATEIVVDVVPLN